MNGELVKTITEDKLELDGFFAMPKDATSAIIHVPGSEGTFYENYFVMPIARRIYQGGHAFLSVNTRGSGTFTAFRRITDKGVEYADIGAARELFEESFFDIDAWVRFLQGRGIKSIILEGHSWGCHKIANYASDSKAQKIAGLIFLSPSDWIGYQVVFFASRYDADKELARSMVASGRGAELMPKEAFVYPVDAKSYDVNLGIDTKTGIFNFYDDSATFDVFESFSVPVLATFGSENEVQVKDPAECVKILRRHIGRIPALEAHIVKGAPHNYAQHEQELADIIGSWVDKTARTK